MMLRILTLTLALAGLGAAVPTVHAGTTCSGSSSGFGWEYPSCSFSCTVAETVGVAVSMNANDYVDGFASCGGATASCSDTDGGCNRRGTNYSGRAGTGSCRGSGYSAGYKSVAVHCVAGSPQAVDLFINRHLSTAVPGPAGADTEWPLLERLGITSWVALEFGAERALASTCSAGGGCLHTLAACTEEAGRILCTGDLPIVPQTSISSVES